PTRALLRRCGGRRGRRRKVGALDLPRLVALEHVAFLHVVEAVEEDSALEAFTDLAHIVLEALQLRDRSLVDHGSVADDPHARAAANDTARDHAAGDRSEPRHLEERTHLRLAQRLLLLDRPEHADERLLDVVREVVDHTVRPDLDVFALRETARLRVRPDVESDDHRVRCGSEHDVVLRDTADALVDDVDAHFRVLDLRQLADDGFDRSDDVALDDEVEVLHGARLHLLEEALEGDARRPLLRELLAPQPVAANVREIARAPLVLDDAAELTCGRRLVEAADLDRIAGLRLLELLAAEVVERANLPPGVPCDDRIADAQRSTVDEHRRHRAAADIEARLDDRA